ncbi:MAG TPA: MFS transporter [Elusimicrobia bacterium]|nr:MFS transporter [Elusimicrobiota bacterium]HBT61607.1 MFS transporter [Elusimicrobiota bacterium]
MSSLIVHSPKYRARRFLNWFPLGLTYATFYMGRYNLNVAGKTMMDMFHLSKAEFGVIATAGFWTYAVSVMFNGPLADRIGGRKAIMFGALGAALLNLAIGLLFLSGWQTKLIVGMSLLYAANQYFQSFGALSVVKVNAPWFHVQERGVFGGIFGIMISSGYFLAMTVGGWILAYLPWYYVFLIPSAAIGVMCVVDFFMVRDTPAAAGFPDFNTGDATAHDPDRDKPVDWNHLVSRVFTNRVIIILAVSEFCTGFVRQGIMLWFVPFLKEVHNIEHGSALFSVATIGVTVGGICGGLLCGYLSDHWFQSRRPPVAFLFYLGQIVSLIILGRVHSAAAASFMIGFTCMWIFGVHGMLSGTASMDFGGSKAASTVAGLLDGVQYLASGLTGFFLGHFLDKWGWDAWTWMIIPFSIMGAVLMTRLWHETPLKHRGEVTHKERPPAAVVD